MRGIKWEGGGAGGGRQLSLFEAHKKPLREAIEFYKHKEDWSNRLVAGDSLLVMNSLLEKDLLADGGSVFIQISDQNAHFIRNILDGVFGYENFVVDIIFTKTGSKESGTVDPINDHLIWYVKDKSKVRYRRLFQNRTLKDLIDDGFKCLDKDGNVINNIPENYDSEKVIRFDPITSDGYRDTTTVEVEFEGKKYFPGKKSHWKTSVDGLKRLDKLGRLIKKENSLQYIRKLSDFPVKALPTTSLLDRKPCMTSRL